MESYNPELIQIADTLAKSVEVILNATTSSIARAQAQGYYDRVRANTGPADLCNIGFILLSSNVSAAVIQAGLQFIQNTVRYHWSELDDSRRQTVKEAFLTNIQTNSSLRNTPFVQESLAKTIVEIAKKEWPQLWPEFFDQMINLSESSNIPLLVLRRLIEDVISLDTIDSRDRKVDLMQSLKLSSANLIGVLFNALEIALTQYSACATNASELKRRVVIILSVVSSCFEWVNTSVILAGDRIYSLLYLLRYKDIQLPVVECLQQVLERKGTKKESEVPQQFMSLGSTECIITGIVTCGTMDSEQQTFHKIGDLLILLGSALQVPRQEEITNFSRCITVLCKTGDIKTQGLAAAAFCNLTKNVERQPEPRPELDSLQEVISIILQKFIAPPNMNEKNEVTVLKQHLISLLRTAARLNERYYLVVSQWYHEQLQKKECTPPYQWDVLAFVFDAVASSISYKSDEIVKAGLNDLKTSNILFREEEDPTLKSSHLSIISSLFVFLKLANHQNSLGTELRSMMESIFIHAFGTFTPGDISEAQNGLRNHVAAFLIKLATRFPALLTTSFQFLSNLASATAPTMRHIESQFTMECFFIICNTWKDINLQKQLVEHALQIEGWAEIERLVTTPEAFLTIFQEQTFIQKKSIVSHNLHMLLATLRRIRAVAIGPTQEKVHAAYETSRVLLPIVFQYVKMMYNIIGMPQFQSVVNLTESEKSQVLGIVHFPGTYPRPPGGRPQSDAAETYRTAVLKFIRTSIEMAYSILGLSCVQFASDLYNIPNIEELFLNSVGWKMNILPDYRVRNIVQGVYRPFLHCCPAFNQDLVLTPFLTAFTPFMFERLAQRWNQVQQQACLNNSDGDEENEILEAAVLRLLTREYIDIIHVVLEGGAQKKDYLKQMNGLAEDDVDGMDVEMNEDVGDQQCSATENQQSQGLTGLSPFGANLLKDLTCYQSIIHLAGTALCWDDSAVVYRAARCLILCWEYVALNIDVVLGTLKNTLVSISSSVDNEATKEILTRLIDLIHRRFHKEDSRINRMILEWGGSDEDLKKLSGAASEGTRNDKRRKDIIRRMVKTNPNLGLKKLQKSSWFDNMPKLISLKEKLNTEVDADLNEAFALVDTLIP